MSRIQVLEGNNIHIIDTDTHGSVLELLRDQGFAVDAPCGGGGTCGKCKVRIRNAQGEQTVLACQTSSLGVEQIILPEDKSDTILTEDAPDSAKPPHGSAGIEGFDGGQGLSGRQGLGAAVDLGTTTVAVSVFDLATGERLSSRGERSALASYGADVISRIQYIMENPDGLAKLRDLTRKQIGRMIGGYSSVREVYLSGNTVMQHIFAGISPESIAAVPFTPESLFEKDDCIIIEDTPVWLSPCVAGYVGGDITAGLLYAGIDRASREERKTEGQTGNMIFLDVGTNGEMVLGRNGDLLSCAVASGPAFEGAEISCGMTASEGAVSEVTWNGRKLELTVIGGGKAKGICGSGLLDLLAVLLKLGIIDESGWLMPPDEIAEECGPQVASLVNHFDEDENGNGLFYLTSDRSVYLTAADVRKLQLAKAAVAAGINVLMSESGLDDTEIDRLYLAGGFGNHLNLDSAVAIGMIPVVLRDKIVYLGNSSLGGTQMELLSGTARDRLKNIGKSCSYLELSGNPKFNDEYIEQMNF